MSQPSRKVVLLAMVALSALLSLAGAFILTDAGQIFDISKEVVIGYFRIHLFIMCAAVGLMLAGVALNRVWKVLHLWQEAIFVIVVVGGLLATKFATPYVMFPSKQHTAVYKGVSDSEGYLQPDDTVYVVEHNGVARAYPQRLIWQAHIFGGDYGGDDIVFTYCVLTNLPVPYRNDLDGEAMDLRVLAQTNNNLLLWDTRSGEIIQQITSMRDISNKQLEPLPTMEMSWSAYNDLYPDGTVAFVEFRRPLERILDFLMPLEAAHEGDDWMFKTVDLEDDRLHSKEKIVGVADDGDAVAYTRDALVRAGVTNVSVGRRALALVHIPENDVIVAFDRRVSGKEVVVEEVDFFGNTEAHGRLQRAFVHNGPMWAVWLHYFPHTDLVK
jgi:hypothetical protein